MTKSLRPYVSTKEFDDAMTLLANELVAADLTYGLYSEIGKQTEEHKALYRRTWSFWLQLQHSVLNDTILTLGRLYDKDEQTSSLRTMLRRLLLDIRKDHVSLEKDLSMVERTDPVVHRLGRMRDELLAHTNYKRAAALKCVEPKFLLLVKDVPMLIDRAMEIYSRHSGKFMSRDINQHFIPRSEAKFIFGTLQEKLDQNMRDARALLEEQGVNPDVFLDDEKILAEMQRLNNMV